MTNRKRGFLQLVWDSVAGKDSVSDAPAMQMDLFAHNNEHSILVIYFSDIDKKSFSSALKSSQPSNIIDMRPNPRFDISGYSRKMAFTEFESIGAKYFDYLELLGADKKDKQQIVNAIEIDFFDKLGRGPLAFIFGNKEQDTMYEEELMHKLLKNDPKWSLSIVSK